MSMMIRVVVPVILALAITGCPAPQDNAKVDSTPVAHQPSSGTTTSDAIASEPGIVYETLDRSTFIFTSDFQAFQRPCGCATAQHGGLLRLATITQTVGEALHDLDASALSDFSVGLPSGLSGEHQLWLVDCGNFADASRRLPGLRVGAHLAALAEGGAVAAVINQNELLLSEAQATAGFTDAPIPLACCNVATSIPGVEFKGSVQLAKNWYLIGLAARPKTKLAKGQGGWWQFNDPLQSVVQALSELPDGANVVVAAAHQPSEVISGLQQLDVRAVVGGDGLGTAEVSGVLAPRFDNPGGMGRKLQLLSFDDGFSSGFEPWFVVSGEEWPDDPGVAGVLKVFQDELKQQLAQEMAALYGEGGYENISWGMGSKYLPPAEDAEIIYEGLHYVGVTTCKECHRDEHNIWRKTRHALAWDSLVAVAGQDSYDCMRCHTTGVFEPGGYLPFAPDNDLLSVGCESCHGPGSDHVEWAYAREAGANGSSESKIDRSSIDGCLTCHDSYNSPDFDAKTYWDSVGH